MCSTWVPTILRTTYISRSGKTWCVITSPVEGDTHIIAYAPGIYDWNKHKVFAAKHWYDVKWVFPAAGDESDRHDT